MKLVETGQGGGGGCLVDEFLFFLSLKKRGGAYGERESEGDSLLSGEPDKGLDLWTLRS